MKQYVLIGGMASGKSTVAQLFQQHGAALVDLDMCGHDALLQPAVIDRLVQAFGDGVLDADGTINRHALAQKAFASEANTATLNAITHPALLALAQQRITKLREEGAEFIVVELSAYNGSQSPEFDALINASDGIITVVSPLQNRIDRAVAKGFDEQDVRQRIALQPTDEQRKAWAQYVIDNTGTLDSLSAAVDGLWRTLV